MKRKGFTLIELLVVIAIIGILATVLLVNLSTGRDKARATTALESLKSVQSVAIMCIDAAGALVAPANDGNICNPATSVADKYPTLDSSWSYNNTAFNATSSINGYSSATTGTFTFGAQKGSTVPTSSAKAMPYIVCDENACTKANF